MNWETLESMAIPEPNSGCLLWNERREVRGGYGVVAVNNKRNMAHRVAYELTKGPIPSGLLVCHKCDVRACINPEHLFLGTYKDNTADMMRKGRHRPHTSKQLTDAQVLEIFQSGELYRNITEKFGVLMSTVSQIKRGQRFTRVTGKQYEKKSHCANGHPWIEDNIYRRRTGSGYCRLCERTRRK
jgi:hypothetical protein